MWLPLTIGWWRRAMSLQFSCSCQRRQSSSTTEKQLHYRENVLLRCDSLFTSQYTGRSLITNAAIGCIQVFEAVPHQRPCSVVPFHLEDIHYTSWEVQSVTKDQGWSQVSRSFMPTRPIKAQAFKYKCVNNVACCGRVHTCV